jgi:cyclophilin family peptidyl-prolyl cis-trans isomerase
VASFIENVKRGVYDGVCFAEGLPDLMVFCGAYMADGSLNTSYVAPPPDPEYSAAARHVRGAVGVRTYSPGYESHEFYVCLSALPRWDGKSTLFAEVVDGLDLLDEVAASVADGSDRTSFAPAILSITIE